jgi:LPXTG-site transpeptidase (sortase) family protein
MAGLATAGFGLAADWSARVPTAEPAASPVGASIVRVYGPPVPPVAAPSVGAVPVGISIPALALDVPVVPASTVDGVLVPPSDPQQLGWWRDGARAGSSQGRVLLTGHTVHTGGGALDHLGDLGIGDRMVVTTTHGTVAYAVESVTYYPKQTLAEFAAATFTQTGPPRLVLITCERWNGASYDGNAVVVARPVEL